MISLTCGIEENKTTPHQTHRKKETGLVVTRCGGVGRGNEMEEGGQEAQTSSCEIKKL